jgi:ribosomal protein S18 acetylase RimI-like enzyme/tetratricopeptide (TPR) repeat protein
MPPLGPRGNRTPRPRKRPAWQPTATQLRGARAQQQGYVSTGKAVERIATRRNRAVARARRPTATQLRSVRAQRQGYVSLGRAVPKVAHEQRVAARDRRILRVARAQRDYLRTQGELVKQMAREHTKPGGLTQSPTEQARSYLIAQKKPVGRIGLTTPKETQQLAGLISKQGYDKALRTFRVDKAERDAAERAPLLWTLKQASRPLYGSAGASLALVKGKSPGKVLHEAKRGLQLKDQHTYSDVLGATGWKPKSGLGKAARGTLGFGLDVALDPTTYLSFGTVSVGEKALGKAAQRVAEDAARASAKSLAPKVAAGKVTKSEAERIAKARGRAAGRQHMERGIKQGRAAGPRGITVKVAGGKHVRRAIRKTGLESKPAPRTPLPKDATRAQRAGRTAREVKATAAPLTRATGQAGQAVRFLAPKGRKATQIRSVTRHGASQLHANVRPHDLSKAEQRLVKTLRREARAEGEATTRRVASRSNRLLARLGEHEQRQVIDAIEADKIGSLKGQAEKLGVQQKRRVVTAVRSRKTRRDPDRLFNVARQVRSDIRHLNRVGRRSGLLAGQVGRRGRTRVEAALSAHATPRSVAPVRAALTPALKERALARENVRRAKTGETLPSREEFIRDRPKAARGTPDPTVENLTQNVKPGKPGISVEREYIREVDRAGTHVGWGREVPGGRVRVIVARDKQGKPIGALRVLQDEHGKADILEVAVDPAHRGKGLAAKLYARGEREGFEVEAASGRGGYTEAGAATAHKRRVEGARVRRDTAAKHAARHAEAADMRVDNLRRALVARTEGHARAQAAKGELRRVRSERLKGEAKGYFPRTNEADKEERGFLARMARGTEDPKAIPRAEQLGSNVPKAGAAERRQFRKSRADLEQGTPKERKVAEALTSDVRETLSKYGTSVSRASAARNLNTRLLQSGRKLPANLSHDQFEALKARGESVYRVRRGVLEKVDDFAHARRAGQTEGEKARLAKAAGDAEAQKAALLREAEGAKPKQAAELRDAAAAKGAEAETLRGRIGTGGGGQYAILKDPVVRHVRERAPVTDNVALQAFDKAQSTFKGVALATPGYLVRNVLGDAFNAAVHENPFTLARNVVKGQKALNALGRYEKANRVFEKALTKDKRTIKLSKEQAAALGTTKTEIPAMQAALLAEKMGVIRQGRFLELIEEGAKRPRGTHAWENAVKRVEDSVRMTTFMGSLHRGLDPSEAAANASKIHFDYGDLTGAEKNFMRRLMPFYTFTSRNLPLQVEGILKHPGKYAAVAHARDEGRKQSGLPIGFESGLSPYEMRQGGIPFKFGGKQYTLSVGSPFVDLNDTARALATENPGKGIAALGQKVAELSSPILKTPVELAANYSFFYRDQIQHESEPLTRAPAWAVEAAKVIPGFAKTTGFVPDYVPPEGGKTPGWGRKADYAFRQLQPGPIGPLVDVLHGGVQGANARAMTPRQRALAAFGPRAIEYKANQARINRIYNRLDQIKAKAVVLRRRAHPTDRTPDGRPYRINAEHPTPAFLKLAEEESKLQKELQGRVSRERPGGFVGGEAVPKKVGRALGGSTLGGRGSALGRRGSALGRRGSALGARGSALSR